MDIDQSPIFIVGCARSGTSLLRDILTSHPRIGSITAESKFFSDYYGKYGDLRNTANLQQLHKKFTTSLFFQMTELDGKEILTRFQSFEPSYAKYFSTIMQAYIEQVGKKIWVEKTPDHALYLREILDSFPSSRILFIVRDGRDVSLSFRGKFDQDPSKGFENEIIRTLITALKWRQFNTCPLYKCLELPMEKMKIIEYERLVNEQIDYINKIFEFLDCAPVASLSEAEGLLPNWHTLKRSNSSYQKSDNTSSGINTLSVGRWKTSMRKQEISVFELINHDLILMLGYETTGGKLRGSISLLAAIIWAPFESLKVLKKYRKELFSYFSDCAMIKSLNLTSYKI